MGKREHFTKGLVLFLYATVITLWSVRRINVCPVVLQWTHYCRALIIYRQVKPAVVARNQKSLNKEHPVTMIFLNEHGVSSSRVFFFLIYISLFLFLCLNVLVK